MIGRRQCFRFLAALPAGGLLWKSAQRAWGALSSAGSTPADEDEAYWNRLRWQFMIPADQAYFNTGSLGASPHVVLNTVMSHLRFTEERLAEWDFSGDKPARYAGYHPELTLRRKLARLLHCDAADVGWTINATMGMNFVASGIDLKPGDEILITNREHPGGRSGWDLKQKRYGAVVKEVDIPTTPKSADEIVSAFASSMTPATKVMAVPHMTSAHGTLLPVRRLCQEARKRGIFSVIDGAQTVGQIDVDVRALECDAYFSSPHKWLLAPKGTGLLYVRKEAQPRIWATLASSQWNNYRDGMFRLSQIGSHNMSVLRGLEAALDFMHDIGSQRIERRVRFLAETLRKGLRQIPAVTVSNSTDPTLAAAITNYGIEGISGRRLQDELWNQKKIRVRAVGSDAVRQCCHIYNDPDQIEMTLKVVRALAAGGGNR